MNKKLIIEATEREILSIINKHFPAYDDSIVAIEELGNQKWNVDVKPLEVEKEHEILNSPKPIDFMFNTSDILNHLCFLGELEEGSYIIDCTW